MSRSIIAVRALTLSTAAIALIPAVATAQQVFTLDEIVIAPTLTPEPRNATGASVSVITQDEIARSAEPSTAALIARQPGVSLAATGGPGNSAGLRVRGLAGSYVAVRVDGIDVSDPAVPETAFDFGGLPTAGIGRLELLRGSQSALYGSEAVAGVVDIRTLTATEFGTTLSFGAELGSNDTARGAFSVQTRTDRAALAFTLSHESTDGFSAADENDGNDERDGFDSTRLSFSGEVSLSETLTFGASGFWQQERIESDGFPPPFFALADTDSETDKTTSGARVFLRAETGAVTHELSASTFRTERETTESGTTSRFEGKRDEVRYQGDAQLGEQWRLVFGLDSTSEEAIYANAPGGRRDTRTDGAFVQALFAPSDRLDVGLTARVDDHSAFGSFETGRLSLAFRPDPTLTLRAALANGYRAPSIDELYGSYPGAQFVGNASLTPETSTSAEIGLDKAFSNGATLSATLFAIDIEDEIAYVACPFDPVTFSCAAGTTSTLRNQQGTSQRRGLELSGALPLSDRMTVFGAYTYLDAENADGSRTVRVPRHDLVLGIEAMIAESWSVNASAQHVADFLDFDATFTPAEMPDYTVVNATVTYAFNDRTEAYVRVENLFDQEYQTLRGYGQSDRAVFAGLRAKF